jgi:hypothetical protein
VDALVIDDKARHGDRSRAGGQDDVVTSDREVALGTADLDGVFVAQGGGAAEKLSARPLDELPHAGGQLVDDAALPVLQLADIQRLTRDRDAHRAQVRQLFPLLGGVDERFGWNAADVETDAAGHCLFDANHLLAELTGPNRSDVAARSRADDTNLGANVLHGRSPL